MDKFYTLHLKCEKFFDEFKFLSELVQELSTFEPTIDSINANSLKKYLELLNFLWTEYAFLYNGKATSAYRLELTSKGLHYDGRIPIKKEMASLQRDEKDKDKKSQYKSLLASNNTRFEEIILEINTCQRELKKSADFIYSRVKEKERKSRKSSKFIFSRKLHSSNIPYTLEIYINSEKIEFDINCPGVTPKVVNLQMVQHEWYPRPHYVKEPSIKKTKGNSRQAIASVAAKAPTSVAAEAPTSVAASEEAPAPAAKTPVSTKKRKFIVLSQESESKSESPKSPNLPLIEEAVVITTSATTAEKGISNAQAPAPRRKKVVVLSPPDKYSHSKLSSAVIEEAIVPTSSPDKGLHAHELSRYQFHNERVQSLLAITDLSDHKVSFINVVRDMFAQEEKHCRRSHNYIRQLIHQMVVNNWSFLGFLLHFEKAAFQIKDEIKVEVSSLVPYDSRKSARDKLQKNTRRKINSICVQVMELFKNYAASGEDTHLQSVAIASLWSAMTITDEEMTGMKTLLSQCIANVTAEEALFLDLSGEGCISLREEMFLAIAESGGELERLFRSNQREASIKHLEDLIGVRVEKEFSFKSEVARGRSFRILEDFYESPFRRIGTLVTVPHQSLSSGTMECYDGVAAVPPLVAIESAPATNVENPINVLMDDMAVLALEPVPFDKETRLRKKKDGEKADGVVVVGSGKRSGGGGGGGGKRRQSKKKKVEDKESVLSDKEEESDQELPQQEESDKEEESDSDENSMDVSETQEDKPVAVSDSNFFDMDDENSVNSGIVVRPFFPDHDPDSDDVCYKEDVVVEAESSVIAAPSFNDWKEMLDWIYDTLKEDFSLDEIIEALDSLEVFDAVTDMTEDDDKTSSALSSNNDKLSSSTPIVLVDEPPPAIITPFVGITPIVGITSQTSSTLSSNTDKLSSPTPIVSVDERVAKTYWRPIDASLNPKEKEQRLRKLLTTIVDMDVLLLQILYFVHPHLHYLVKEILSTRYKPKPVKCKCNKRKCECRPPEVLILPMPKAIPIDLFVRASLYRDPKVLKCKCKLMKCKCGKLPMPQEMPIVLYVQANQDLVFLECVKNVPWCIDHFLWYINTYPTHAANFQKWPKCEDAYVDAKECAPLLLMWARKNRCSCIYNFKPVPRRSPKEIEEIHKKGTALEIRNLRLDVRAIRNLSLDERFALTWLEDNQARNWLPHFRYAYDIPIKYNPQRRWRCLWTTWLDDREPDTDAADRQADLDEDDIVEYMDITNAVDFETNVVPKEVIESVARMLATSVRVSNTSLDSSSTSIWTYENELNSTVTDKQVIISPTFIYRHQVTVALTVLAHAIRMEILQNDDVANCRPWLSFIHAIECKNKSQYEAISTYYSRLCKNNNNIIPLLMDRCPAVQLNLFSDKFFQKFEIRLTSNDQRADIDLKVQRALLTAKADTRLYVCEIFESTSSSRAADLYLPLLIRKDNICLQNVATIYEKGSDRSLLFRLITRSRIGLCDNKYVWCEYSWNSFSGAFGIQKPVAVPTNGEIFPCKLGRDHKLIACVYIPTKTQHIPQDCHSAMKLSESEDLLRKNWAVKDCLSIDPSSNYPLTKRVLHKMAGDLMTKYSYYQSNQHFLVSDTLVDELNSFEVNLSQSKSASVNYPPSSSSSSSSSTSIQFSNELIQLKEFLTQGDKHGCVHLLISYKKSEERGCSSWVYAYFLLHTRELVIMTRRCDNVRDIMNIGACLKRFISIALPSVPSIPIAQVPSIPIAQVLWRSRTLCDRELSGYYAFKQFWKHAEIIRSSITTKKSKAFSETYTSKINDYDPDEDTKFPSWGLLEITGKQVVQLIKDIRAELFPSKCKKANSDPAEKFYVQDFLLKQ